MFWRRKGIREELDKLKVKVKDLELDVEMLQIRWKKRMYPVKSKEETEESLNPDGLDEVRKLL